MSYSLHLPEAVLRQVACFTDVVQHKKRDKRWSLCVRTPRFQATLGNACVPERYGDADDMGVSVLWTRVRNEELTFIVRKHLYDDNAIIINYDFLRCGKVLGYSHFVK